MEIGTVPGIQIGRVTIQNPLVLAPMAGVTNWPFRLLCKEQGCGLLCTEMVSDKALIYDSRRTFRMLTIMPAEHPISVQLFGAEPDSMAEAARIVAEQGADLIDINMGCPAPKIVKGRGGCSLMREPDLAGSIVSAVVRAVDRPVTVKMRLGWDSDNINVLDLARRAEQAGASAVTVHGRTRVQFYSGRADWEWIDRVARSLSIPVIGNGDIWTPEDAALRLRTTSCVGVMVGRGALGNPWLFGRIMEYLRTGRLLPDPGAQVRVQTAIRHMRMLIEYKGEYLAVREMRKHAAWYLKGLPGAAETRLTINSAETPEQMQETLLTYLAGPD